MKISIKKVSFIIMLLFVLGTKISEAQVINSGFADTTAGEHIGRIALSAYIDGYYGFNFNQPASGDNPYMYSMSRHNEFNINLAYVDLRFNAKRLRARYAPGIGTYMNANYAAEPGLFKSAVDASMGVKLFDKKDIWIDFGIIGSPYTYESYLSKDHLMYTRSFAAENSPYYLTGVKLCVPINKKFSGYLYLVNGWQQIQDVNKGKSIGTQIEYRPNDKTLINWNTYVGDERSAFAPQNRMRYFTDLYLIYNPEGKVTITSDAYVGLQQKKDSLNNLTDHYWWQANFVARYRFTENLSLSGRFEYYSDPGSVIISPITPVNRFSTYTTGLCLNVKLYTYALFRMEGRYLFSEKDVYLNENSNPVNNSTWLISNLTVWF